jgi:hypothetical protein
MAIPQGPGHGFKAFSQNFHLNHPDWDKLIVEAHQWVDARRKWRGLKPWDWTAGEVQNGAGGRNGNGNSHGNGNGNGHGNGNGNGNGNGARDVARKRKKVLAISTKR